MIIFCWQLLFSNTINTPCAFVHAHRQVITCFFVCECARVCVRLRILCMYACVPLCIHVFLYVVQDQWVKNLRRSCFWTDCRIRYSSKITSIRCFSSPSVTRRSLPSRGVPIRLRSHHRPQNHNFNRSVIARCQRHQLQHQRHHLFCHTGADCSENRPALLRAETLWTPYPVSSRVHVISKVRLLYDC